MAGKQALMFSTIRLLFSKRYWRHILLGSTWYEAWLNLRRIHKDRRARRHLFRLLLLVFYPLFLVLYILFVLASGAFPMVAVFLVLAIPVVWWIRQRAKRDAPLHITPQSDPIPPPPPLTPEAEASLREYLARLAILHAVLLDRAGSESFLRNQELPPGVEIVSRRTHIDLLRDINLWDDLAPSEREAIMMPDGHWEPERIHQINFGMETLRLLRWILRIDFFLPAVGRQPKGDYALAHDLVNAPKKALQAKQIIPLDTLQLALNAAEQYYLRCLAETIHRGYTEPANDEIKQWASNAVASVQGKQEEDLTLGVKIISEADQSELLITSAYSQIRVHFLRWVRDLLRQEKQPEIPFRFLA